MWPLPLTSISDIKLKEATALPAAAKLPATSTAAAAGDVETVGLDSYASRQQEQMSSFAATLTAVAKGTCPDVPSANGKAPAPTPAIDGPTFYRCTPLLCLIRFTQPLRLPFARGGSRG